MTSNHELRALALLRGSGVSSTLKALVSGLAVVTLASGCATRQPAPVSERQLPAKQVAPAPAKPAAPMAKRPDDPPGQQLQLYTVRPGDTLYSIATAHGLDHRELAIWNGVDNPHALKVGMQLRLTPPPGTPLASSPAEVAPAAPEGEPPATTAPLRAVPGSIEMWPLPGEPRAGTPTAGEVIVSEPRAVRLPYSEQALAQVARAEAATSARAPKTEAKPTPRPEPALAHSRVIPRSNWVWPASGKLIASFEANANKGIDIGGKIGQPVVASAAGRVIFSGTMRGLGKVIVIQHADELISVYAHNNELLVKQGQEVSGGQKIAEMGASDAEQAKLHFQIRRRGNPNPIDPLSILPARAG
jgi:lipoprotein NlpD